MWPSWLLRDIADMNGMRPAPGSASAPAGCRTPRRRLAAAPAPLAAEAAPPKRQRLAEEAPALSGPAPAHAEAAAAVARIPRTRLRQKAATAAAGPPVPPAAAPRRAAARTRKRPAAAGAPPAGRTAGAAAAQLEKQPLPQPQPGAAASGMAPVAAALTAQPPGRGFRPEVLQQVLGLAQEHGHSHVMITWPSRGRLPAWGNLQDGRVGRGKVPPLALAPPLDIVMEPEEVAAWRRRPLPASGLVEAPTVIRRYGTVRTHCAGHQRSSALGVRGKGDFGNQLYFDRRYKEYMSSKQLARGRYVNPAMAEWIQGFPTRLGRRDAPGTPSHRRAKRGAQT